jgi:hypothetical protein
MHIMGRSALGAEWLAGEMWGTGRGFDLYPKV